MQVNSETFEKEVLKSDIPVLADFFVSWCGPCKMVAPFLEEIATEMAGQVKVCKIDVEECPELAEKYSILTVPTFILFINGKEVAKNIGAINKARTENFIKHNI